MSGAPSNDFDVSSAWDAAAASFVASRSNTGARTVQLWAQSLPKGAAVIDVGCGAGIPIARVLVDGGFAVYGLDSSPSMVTAFRSNLPDVPVACESVGESSFFGRTFDGAVAWGLIFLLPADLQRATIHRIARALTVGGRFLFTAPRQASSWVDASTGQVSVSLGADAYRAELEAAGLAVVGEHEDEGGNHYYDAVRV
jgi:SAM-dependent methyltransferase